jgi:ParB family transcriptional regulator, chromosome partitioning protein
MVKLSPDSDLMCGIIEDVDTSRLKHTNSQFLRSALNDVSELANSIDQKGLLQAIVVRSTTEEYFEVVAGNRRLCACKALGWRKIPCHIVELDDRGAFETSLIENIQRQRLNPIDEANAFKAYINDYGWGGVSHLAEKIGKSPSYITKRIKLLDLPSYIRDSISSSVIFPSTAEELAFMKDKRKQLKLAVLTDKGRLSIKVIREISRNSDNGEISSGSLSDETIDSNQMRSISKTFDKSIIGLRIAMNRLVRLIEAVEDNWVMQDLLMEHKNLLHAQIDLLMKQKKKFVRSESLLNGSF